MKKNICVLLILISIVACNKQYSARQLYKDRELLEKVLKKCEEDYEKARDTDKARKKMLNNQNCINAVAVEYGIHHFHRGSMD